MNFHGTEVDVQDEHSDTLKKIYHGWEAHASDFDHLRSELNDTSDKKMYLTKDVVFEKREGKYILRKSSSAY